MMVLFAIWIGGSGCDVFGFDFGFDSDRWFGCLMMMFREMDSVVLFGFWLMMFCEMDSVVLMLIVRLLWFGCDCPDSSSHEFSHLIFLIRG
ncbi:hypothetical protein A2U01_0052446, partial [Trifolium medium]|nr:hypothetical protein [Trifolium medium]